MLQAARLCFILLVMALAAAYKIPENKGDNVKWCEWNIRDDSFPDDPPLFLDSKNQIVRPVRIGDDRLIRFRHGRIYNFVCSGESNGFKKFSTKNEKKKNIKVQCNVIKSGPYLRFKEKAQNYEMKEMACIHEIKESIGSKGKSCNSGLGILIEISFETYIHKPKRLINICFGDEWKNTYWTQHIIEGRNLKAKDQNARGSIKTDKKYFKKLKMNAIYKPSAQKELLDQSMGKNYINNNRRYLEKGHLSPVADFVSTAEMKATNWYINVVPQWMTINQGNWFRIEVETRKFAKENNYDLTIISGGAGILDLPNEALGPNPIFLGHSEEFVEFGEVPAPQILWKVVIVKDDEGNNDFSSAIAFLVINNPFMEKKPDLLCPNICDNIEWIQDNFAHYERENVCFGFTYCCAYEEFVKLDIIPKFDDNVGAVARLED